MPSRADTPVAVRGDIDEPLGRWRWLVKWFLVIPHLVVLFFLWVAFFALTFVAGVSIAFTGRYPAEIFEFNVGVLRWTWRVHFYAFTLGTDRYPPFSLQTPTYPAQLAIERPAQLSRGLVWVKWWLLAIPQYLVVAAFAGGANVGSRADRNPGADRRCHVGSHPALPALDLRLRHGHAPLVLASRGLRRAHDRRVSAVPTRSRTRRTRGRARAGSPAC